MWAISYFFSILPRLADRVLAIEVKNSHMKGKHPGLTGFLQEFAKARSLLVGYEGIPIAEFLSHPASHRLKMMA